MFSLHEENKMLQQKVQVLEMELFVYKQQALLNQQLQVATDHLNKCKIMVNDLNETLAFVINKGVPSISDYHRSIDQWRMELQKTEQSMELLQVKVNSDLIDGNCTTIEQPPELCVHLKEPRDILHDNFITAVSSVCSAHQSTPDFISDPAQRYKILHKSVLEETEDVLPIQENLVQASSSLNIDNLEEVDTVSITNYQESSSQSPKSNSHASNSDKYLDGPNFSKLCTYIKNKIPDIMETELLSALKAVRKRYSKLTGLSKHTIVACVYAELYRSKHDRDTEASASPQ